jgi:hypothetical protein
MHWPLAAHLDRDVPRDIGDPLVQAWQVAWGGHALLHQPLDYFQANTFWPLRDSLAFSDALVGYAPAGVVGHGPHAAIVRYDLLFLFAYALAFLGAYLLARELGVGYAGAGVAGAGFAYAPWRLEQDGHLHVLSSGGIPLSLFLLLRGYRRGRPWTVLAGWLVAAWQVSLGFTLGLQLVYLLAPLGLVAGPLALRRRTMGGRALAAASVAGVGVLLLAAGLLARPYLRVLDHHPEAHRTAAQVAGLSGPLRQFLAAPEENLVWGEATQGIRDGLSSVPEQTLFPGVAIVALALAGVVATTFPRRLRLGLAVATLGLGALSLGFHQHGVGTLYPYRLLYEYAPGWRGIRAPGRLMTLTSLALALLAAAGAQALIDRLGRRAGRSARRTRLLTGAVAAALAGAILVEGAGFSVAPKDGPFIAGPGHPGVPTMPKGQAGIPAPQLHLPLTVPANRRYVLWSTEGFPRIVNGRGSFDPRFFVRLGAEVRGFPDAASVSYLRSVGVRTVVVHPDLAGGTQWRNAERHPREGLSLRRLDAGSLLVYRLK